jgi:hypothetical protein
MAELYEQTNQTACSDPETFEQLILAGGRYYLLDISQNKLFVYSILELGDRRFHAVLGTNRVAKTIIEAWPTEKEFQDCALEKVRNHRAFLPA